MAISGVPRLEAQESETPRIARRMTLARTAVGGTIFALLVAACGGAASPAPSTAPGTTPAPGDTPAASVSLGETSLGSNESDEQPKAAVQSLVDYCQTSTGASVKVNVNDHNTFQNQISSYLQGTPDDIVKWFAGNRLRFFADQGLLSPIDDVWAEVGANYSDAFKVASTGNDGKLYFVPSINYPWVVMYRKSVFTEKAYAVPTTLAEFKTLGDKMLADGIAPLAFGDLDGWPAMGTFDILNMRLNGYDFHVGLMAGTEKWSDPRVKAVFQMWAELLPYFQAGAPGRTWQDAAKAMIVDKTAGMYFLGTFAAQQAPTPEDVADIGFFPFPVLGNQYDSEKAIDAPIDGFMMSANPKNPEAAKAFLKCVATAPAQKIYTSTSAGDVATVKDADTSGYNDVQKAAAAIIADSGRIAQFLDRDARADFAGPSGMQGFLLSFLNEPNQNLDTFLGGIQSYYDSLPPQQ